MADLQVPWSSSSSAGAHSSSSESVDMPSFEGSPLQQLQSMLAFADFADIDAFSTKDLDKSSPTTTTTKSRFPRRLFMRTMSVPTILAAIIPLLDSFRDFLSIVYCCKVMRDLADMAFEEAIVKAAALRRFVPSYPAKRDNSWNVAVRMGLPDFEMFLESNHMPLHRYPSHALMLLSIDYEPTPAQNELTSRLTFLCLGHSRVALFLKARQPSVGPISPQQDEEDYFYQWDRYDPAAGRNLVFPAPLSYFPASSPSQELPGSVEAAKLRRKLKMVLSGTKTPPPPPSLKSRRAVDSYWEPVRHRRAVSSTTRSPTPSTPDLTPSTMRSSHRRFMSHSQTDTTLPTSSTPSPQGESPSIATPIHDISRVFTRNRAPILRVYVPCSVLNEEVLAACEDQLITAGLWDALVFGDIVCNLGYVPEDGEPDAGGWLIYTGNNLMRFSSLTLFRDAPWLLPSPWYFSHITPPQTNLFVTLGFIRFRPVSPLPTGQPRLTLTQVTSLVPSPTSWTGQAKIQTYVWVSQVLVVEGVSPGWRGEWTLQVDGTPEGRSHLLKVLEWTSEQGPHPDRWEIMRDRSGGGGKLWLRLANLPVVHADRPASLVH